MILGFVTSGIINFQFQECYVHLEAKKYAEDVGIENWACYFMTIIRILQI